MSFIPKFEKGLILKQKMLEALRDYPLDFIKVLFAERGDGIISGFDILIDRDDKNKFVVTPGIIKKDGEIFCVTEEKKLDFLESENYVYLKFSVTEEVDGCTYSAEIEQKSEEDSSLFELFRYVRNAEMKEYADIEEILTPTLRNRIDRKHVRWSINGGSTLNPQYYKAFAEFVLKSSNSSAKDYAFAFSCLNGIEDSSVIRSYFEVEDISNEKILGLIGKKIKSFTVSDQKQNEKQTVKNKPEKKMLIC